MSPTPMKPKARAVATPSRYMPMLVGEVREAIIGCGLSCRLSGGRWFSSAVTVRR